MVARGGERGFSTEAEVVAPLSFHYREAHRAARSTRAAVTPQTTRQVRGRWPSRALSCLVYAWTGRLAWRYEAPEGLRQVGAPT